MRAVINCGTFGTCCRLSVLGCFSSSMKGSSPARPCLHGKATMLILYYYIYADRHVSAVRAVSTRNPPVRLVAASIQPVEVLKPALVFDALLPPTITTRG